MEISFDTTAAALSAASGLSTDTTSTVTATPIDGLVDAAIRAAWALCDPQTDLPIEVHVATGENLDWVVVRVAAVRKER